MSEFNLSILIIRTIALVLFLKALNMIGQILLVVGNPVPATEALVRLSLLFLALSIMGLLAWFDAPKFGRWLLKGIAADTSVEKPTDIKYVLYACTGFFILSVAVEPIVRIIAANIAKPGIIPIDWIMQAVLLLALGFGLIFAKNLGARK